MKIESKSGVILTFDDFQNIDSWYDVRNIFKCFNAKATFFINSPDKLTKIQLEKLIELQRLGHEVGYHGWRHKKAVDYCFEKGLKSWLHDEIIPGINNLKNKGFEISAFAYPYSQHSQETNDALEKYFSHARTGVGYKKVKHFCEMDEIFTPFENVSGEFMVSGISIDQMNDIRQIKNVFKRLKERSELVVLYGHRIGLRLENTKNLTYQSFLRKILELARLQKLEFFSFSDFTATGKRKKEN